MGFRESGADLNLNLNSSLTFGSGNDGKDYGIEKPGWKRNHGRPVLTMLSLTFCFRCYLLRYIFCLTWGLVKIHFALRKFVLIEVLKQ